MHRGSLLSPQVSVNSGSHPTSPHGSYQIQSATRDDLRQGARRSPAHSQWPATSPTEIARGITPSGTQTPRLEHNGKPFQGAEQAGVQNVINMNHLDTFQPFEHLSSRGAPVTALKTIAKELLTGRV